MRKQLKNNLTINSKKVIFDLKQFLFHSIKTLFYIFEVFDFFKYRISLHITPGVIPGFTVLPPGLHVNFSFSAPIFSKKSKKSRQI